MAFRFEHLDIWKESCLYIHEIYRLVKKFPRTELFALADQLRRAANSIAANIAEGSGSSSRKDFSHYIDISIKSVYETVSHLYLAQQQGYISEEERIKLYKQAELLVKKLYAFRNWLNKKSV